LIEEGSKHFLIGRTGGDGLDGDPDGFAQVDFRPSVWSEGPVALLEELYVRPEKRSKGLGKELMTAVLHLARSREAAMVEVVTGEDDIAARGLYESTGFSNLIEGEGSTSSLYYELELQVGRPEPVRTTAGGASETRPGRRRRGRTRG